MSACALAAGTRESEYLEEAKRWKREELELFAQALGAYVIDAEAEPFTAPPTSVIAGSARLPSGVG